MMESERQYASKQLCWSCAKACGRCAWSNGSFRPIPGWDATPTELTVTVGRKVSSYDIRRCPEYVYDGSNERNAVQYVE